MNTLKFAQKLDDLECFESRLLLIFLRMEFSVRYPLLFAIFYLVATASAQRYDLLLLFCGANSAIFYLYWWLWEWLQNAILLTQFFKEHVCCHWVCEHMLLNKLINIIFTSLISFNSACSVPINDRLRERWHVSIIDISRLFIGNWLHFDNQ